MDNDLSFSLYSAASMLGFFDIRVEAKYRKFASLRAIARREGKTVFVTASEEFKHFPENAKIGLALKLLKKIFGKKSETGSFLEESFDDLSSSATAREFARKAREERGRESGGEASEKLENIMQRLLRHSVFSGLELPKIKVKWSVNDSRRRVGFYDPAFKTIVISKSLDSPKVPEFVLEYVVFHELLHAKHGEKLSGKKVFVHTRAFKEDEEKFEYKNSAEWWLKKNVWRMS
jgi:predicted metal-dependent hydrolase